MLKITYFYRKKIFPDSIESVFNCIKNNLKSVVKIKIYYSRFSTGYLTRIYDVILSTFYQSQVNHIVGDVHFLIILLNKNKTILTIHDFAYYYKLNGLKKFIYWVLWIWLPLNLCRKITTISHAIKNEIISVAFIKPYKISVIHNPLIDNFRPSKKKFNSILPRILQIGTQPNKNLFLNLEVIKKIRCEFVIIGKLNSSLELFDMYKNLNLITMENLSQKSLVEQYKLCDILLFTSKYEGFGLPIIEAQATGRVVVTSNFGAMAEVAGGAACLVDPYNKESIFEGLKKVIKDKSYREDLINKGFQNIQRFNKKKISEQYFKIYKKVISG